MLSFSQRAAALEDLETVQRFLQGVDNLFDAESVEGGEVHAKLKSAMNRVRDAQRLVRKYPE